MIAQAMLAGIERSLALAIARDPLTAKRLSALHGKVILISASSPAWQVYALPGSEGAIQLTAQTDLEADCTLAAPSTLLARLAISDRRKSLLQDPSIVLSGDSQVLIDLQNILGDLKLDGEAELARWFGPVAGYAISNVLRSGHEWGEQAHQSLSQSLGDYLTEEARHLVGKSEAEMAAAQVHDLRLRLDRLDARVLRLETPASEASDK